MGAAAAAAAAVPDLGPSPSPLETVRQTCYPFQVRSSAEQNRSVFKRPTSTTSTDWSRALLATLPSAFL